MSREGRTQIQILESNHGLRKIFFWKIFKVQRGEGEGRTQIQILESNHELPKKKWKIF